MFLPKETPSFYRRLIQAFLTFIGAWPNYGTKLSCPFKYASSLTVVTQSASSKNDKNVTLQFCVLHGNHKYKKYRFSVTSKNQQIFINY